MSHTPAPWHACDTGKCSCKVVSCADYPIAKVTTGDWGDDYASIRLVGESSLDQKAEAYMAQITYGSINEETAIANAVLIAAAPELLEAVQDWLLYASAALHEFDDDEPCAAEGPLCPKCREVGCIQAKIRRAKAAVIKAGHKILAPEVSE